MSNSTIVVTDLDGTLLDHHSYSWQQAEEALNLLKLRHIPLILCSSKTAAEIAPIRKALGNTAPFIVENGGAVYLPDPNGQDEAGENVNFGMNRAEVLSRLRKVRSTMSVNCKGFSEMTVKELMTATGLDEESAANALQREFTEPLLWQDSVESSRLFEKRLHKQGLETVMGGRFLHVSAGCDKGKAVAWLRHYYQKQTGQAPRIIALGDSENDASMLEKADLPVLVKSPVKSFPEIRHRQVYKTEDCGPAGWNKALLEILDNEGTE